MRNQFAETLYQIAAKDPRICIVVADISPAGSIEQFRRDFPQRFIDVGVAEQSMIGVAAGLAMRGLRPFVYDIAPFSIYRPFEMVRVDLCYQNLPVTVVGMGAGIIYASLGSTHHTQEDIAVLGSLPNMSIIAPADPLETIDATIACANAKGPTYLRIGKAGEAKLTANAVEPFEFGKIRYIERGTEAAVITFGHVMDIAHAVQKRLVSHGRSVSLVSCHTIKPLDKSGISKLLKSHHHVIVIEEHSAIGGLASRVKEIAWDSAARCKLDTFSLKDEFIHCYGSHNDIRRAHGIDADTICSKLL